MTVQAEGMNDFFVYTNQCFSDCKVHRSYLGSCQKSDSALLGPGLGLRCCPCNKLPGDATSPGPGIILWVARLQYKGAEKLSKHVLSRLFNIVNRPPEQKPDSEYPGVKRDRVVTVPLLSLSSLCLDTPRQRAAASRQPGLRRIRKQPNGSMSNLYLDPQNHPSSHSIDEGSHKNITLRLSSKECLIHTKLNFAGYCPF